MRILLIFSSSLGDFINFLPFIEHLKVNFPDSDITLLTKSYFKPIIDRININFFDIEYLKIFKLYSENFSDFDNFNYLKNYSLIISFTGKNNLTFQKNLKKINKNTHIIFPINKTSSIHETLYLINSFPFKKRFFPKPKIPLKQNKKEIIAIHPGSGDRRKNLNFEYFLKLSDELPYKVILFGGENEEYLRKKIDNLKICYNLNEVFTIFEKTFLYIGNDSGISHLAGSCNIPSIIFFGPTDFKIWKPIGDNVIVLKKRINCSPCDLNCSKDFQCLKFNYEMIKKIILYYLKNTSY